LPFAIDGSMLFFGKQRLSGRLVRSPLACRLSHRYAAAAKVNTPDGASGVSATAASRDGSAPQTTFKRTSGVDLLHRKTSEKQRFLGINDTL